MKPNQVTYLASESMRTMMRHKGIMVVSVMIMSLTLLVLAVFLLATDNVLLLLDRTREDFKVYVYLEDWIPQGVVEEHHHAIMARPEVDAIEYISKDTALQEFRQELGEDQTLLESLDNNPLPASFRVTLKSDYRDSEQTAAFAEEVGALMGVEEVNYGKDLLARFSFMARVFLYVDVVLGIIVILSSVFIISNTVRLTIMSRLKTIEVLKLVGATNNFIRGPFIIEGAFQGGMAALVSVGLLMGLFMITRRVIPDLTFLSSEKVFLYVVTCVLLGSLGSFAALQRFLRLERTS